MGRGDDHVSAKADAWVRAENFSFHTKYMRHVRAIQLLQLDTIFAYFARQQTASAEVINMWNLLDLLVVILYDDLLQVEG